MHTLLEILQKSEALLRERGGAEARLDAEHLIADTLGCRRMELYLQFDRPMSEDILAQLRPNLARRARREPLSYILGHHPFDNLALQVREGVLIPRPETEELVQIAAERLASPPRRILDIGTGTGAIALWMKNKFPEAEVIGSDQSDHALALARENAQKLELDVTWAKSNWFSQIEGPFDLILSNPPYLTEKEWQTATPEVREHEPKEALVAEAEGTADLQRIVTDSPQFMTPGALLAVETGTRHKKFLEDLCRKLDYAKTSFQNDFHGRQRYFFAEKS